VLSFGRDGETSPLEKCADRRSGRCRMSDVAAKARDFASNAELFVRWFDRIVSDETSALNMRSLHEILGVLQAAAARLTGVAPGDDSEDTFEFDGPSAAGILRRKLPVDAYSAVFDPFEYDPREVDPPKPVMAMISDDLSDIYRNLMEGLVLFQRGEAQSALWHWHFTYYAHWGRHLSHAQSAIWQYLSEGNWS